MYNGVKYNADVKFKNGLCNCQPTKIPDYGKNEWEDWRKLKSIPKLPDHIFDVIKKDSREERPPTTTTTATVTTTTPTTATAEQMAEINKLCSCLSVQQLDDYSTWIKIGRILKKLGAPLRLWGELSKKSTKY